MRGRVGIDRSACVRCGPNSVSENTYFTFFSDLKKRNVTLYVFFEIITSKSRKKSLAKVLSSIFRNEFTYTSLSDRCNSVPSSPSVIHSEPLPNTLFICTVSSRSGCSGCSESEQIRSHDFLRYINLYVCMYVYV